MRRSPLLFLFLILILFGAFSIPARANPAIAIERGEQLIIWTLEETTAAAVFGSVTVACKRQNATDWLCYIPAYQQTNFTIAPNDVLWVSSPLPHTITVGDAPAPTSEGTGCNFTDATSTVFAATYQAITSTGSGTAFYIGNDEWLTAAHVVDDGGTIQLRTQHQRLTATLVGLDSATDLALLRADGTGLTALAFADHDALRPGQTLGAAGFPGAAESFTSQPGVPSVSSGVLSKIVTRNGVQYIQTSAEINPGNSGGALFTDCGAFVGVVSLGFEEFLNRPVEGINYAVALPTIHEQLPRLRAGHVDAMETTPTDTPFGVTALCNDVWDPDMGTYVPYSTEEACYLAGLEGVDAFQQWHVWGVGFPAWEDMYFWIEGPDQLLEWEALGDGLLELAPGEYEIYIVDQEDLNTNGENARVSDPYTLTIEIVISFVLCNSGTETRWECWLSSRNGVSVQEGIGWFGNILNWGSEYYIIDGSDPMGRDLFNVRIFQLTPGSHTVRVGEYRSWGWAGWSAPYTFTVR